MLTPTDRFVDRDMFMRYRGGGIGHKYMREVEEKYENMSRERLRGKQRPKPPQANGVDGNDVSDSDHEPEDLTKQGTSRAHQAGEPGSEGLGNGVDGSDLDGSDDGNRTPPETHSSESDEDEVVDSDEVGSDLGYESYGLAEP